VVNNQPHAPDPPRQASRPLLIALLLCSAVGLVLILTFWPAPRPTPVAMLPEIARSNLTRLNGLWHQNGHTNPFTGVLLDFYPDGSMQSRSMVSNGLLEGLSEGWYTNRQLEVREYYRTNFSNGLRVKWYPGGKKLSEATIVLGKMEGTFRRWYENGKLAEEIPMREGKIEGVGRSYYESGFLKTELTIHDGKEVKANSWPDGQQPGSSP
jgi:hypothetical protein